jgi:phage portal protein BeeE
MGVRELMGRMFGRAKGVEDSRPVILGGRITQVSGAELGALDKMAAAGMVRKGVDSMGGGYQGIPAYWFARAIEVGGQETLFEPYRNSVWVQRAIKKVAGPVASVELVFLAEESGEASAMRDGKAQSPKSKVQSLKSKVGKRVWGRNGKAKAIDTEAAVELPDVAEWLEEPSPGMAWSDFIESAVGWLKLRGEVFWLLSDELLVPFPEARTKLPPIIVARPDRMRQVVEDGELTGWVYTVPGGRAYTLLPAQVIQTKYWNPYDQWRGLAEFDSAAIAAEGDWLAGKFTRNLMANNGDFGGIIVSKTGMPSDPQREQIIADLKAKRQAQLRGDMKYVFMTGDVEVADPKITSVDANFIGQRLESRHEIAAAFGVPMSMFDVKNDYSMGSQSAYYQLILDTCIPCGAKICDGLERLVAAIKGADYELGLLWDEHPVLQAVRRERMDSMEKLANRGMPMRDISDYLGLDLPEFEGDDVGFLPINVTPMESAEEPQPEPMTDQALSEQPINREGGKPGSAEPEAVKAMMKALRGMADGKSQMAKAARTKRQRIWEGRMRARAGIVRAYQSKASKVINDFRVIALRKLETHAGTIVKSVERGAWSVGVEKSLIDLIFNPADFGKHLVLAVNPVAQAAIESATVQVLAQIGKADDPWRMPPHRVLELINSREGELEKVGATVRGVLNTQLSEGYEKGESTAELTDRIRGAFNELSRGEAKRIAVTETNIVYGTSTHETAAAAGVKTHRWVNEEGARPAHEEAGDRYGEEGIPIDEPFIVDGEALMHPGDPSGSAGNIINCRCVEYFA